MERRFARGAWRARGGRGGGERRESVHKSGASVPPMQRAFALPADRDAGERGDRAAFSSAPKCCATEGDSRTVHLT